MDKIKSDIKQIKLDIADLRKEILSVRSSVSGYAAKPIANYQIFEGNAEKNAEKLKKLAYQNCCDPYDRSCTNKPWCLTERYTPGNKNVRYQRVNISYSDTPSNVTHPE